MRHVQNKDGIQQRMSRGITSLMGRNAFTSNKLDDSWHMFVIADSYTLVWKQCRESFLGHVIRHIWPVHSLVTFIVGMFKG